MNQIKLIKQSSKRSHVASNHSVQLSCVFVLCFAWRCVLSVLCFCESWRCEFRVESQLSDENLKCSEFGRWNGFCWSPVQLYVSQSCFITFILCTLFLLCDLLCFHESSEADVRGHAERVFCLSCLHVREVFHKFSALRKSWLPLCPETDIFTGFLQHKAALLVPRSASDRLITSFQVGKSSCVARGGEVSVFDYGSWAVVAELGGGASVARLFHPQQWQIPPRLNCFCAPIMLRGSLAARPLLCLLRLGGAGPLTADCQL